MKDVPMEPSKDEYVLGTGQRLKHAAMKDAPTKSRKEGFVGGMERKVLTKDAIMKDAPTTPRKEGFV
jgi:hypothetical protein